MNPSTVTELGLVLGLAALLGWVPWTLGFRRGIADAYLEMRGGIAQEAEDFLGQVSINARAEGGALPTMRDETAREAGGGSWGIGLDQEGPRADRRPGEGDDSSPRR